MYAHVGGDIMMVMGELIWSGPARIYVWAEALPKTPKFYNNL